MPTPDCSAFTRQLKYDAVNAMAKTGKPKLITHLYTHVPNVSGLDDFLPSFSNKNLRDLRTSKPLYVAGIQYKSRKPSGSYMQG